MKKLCLFAVSALMMATALTGCGDSKDTSKTKDEMTVAIGGDVKDLDPTIASDTITNNVLVELYEGLFEYDKNGNLKNQLCDTYTVSEDGLVYTFKLKDAKWSDGKAVTAKDFEYGIKRSASFGADAYYGHFIYDSVVGTYDAFKAGLKVSDMGNTGVKALDDKTLEIRLSARTPYFLNVLTSGVFYPAREDFAVEKESTWANKKGYPTNGAFVLDYYSAKDKVVLKKNKNYRLADKVNLKKVTFKVMSDQQAQLSAFKTGEIDLATSVPSDVATDKSYKDTLFTIDPFVINYYVTMNATGENQALHDVNIRQALMKSVDRKAILKVLNGGSMQYELFGFIPKGIPDTEGDFRTNADKEQKYAEANVEEAKQLLKAAGYDAKNPLKLTYKYNANQMHTDVAQVLKESWKKVGVEVSLESTEIQAFFDARDNGDFALARHAMSADYMDPTAYLDMYKSSAQKVAVVNDAHYDELLAQANAEADPAKRLTILHEAEKYLVADQAYVIPLFGYSDPMLLQEGISGIESNPAGHYLLAFVKTK